MFSDAEYNSIDFEKIDALLVNSFSYVNFSYAGNNSFGKSYFVGNSATETIKVDLFYTDKYVLRLLNVEKIRLAQVKEIIAMKLEVIANTGRKKDFWDIHELMEYFSWNEIIYFYLKRYPYNYSQEEIVKKRIDFSMADTDLDPICLKHKYW